MDRGYVKLWHKLKDSRCYSRGGVHRALLLTLFTEANWKEGCFRGETILPGQYATSVLGLSQELGFPRTTVQRALADLATDGVVTVENMGNRWTRITLINWALYQPSKEEFGQPVGNQRATDGQPVGKIKDIKNKDINRVTSVSNDTFVTLPQKSTSNRPRGDFLMGKRKRIEGRRKAAFEQFWEAFGYKKGKAEAIDAWAAIPELTNALMEQILEAAKREAARRPELIAQGKTPIYPQGWITGRRWEDEELEAEGPWQRPEWMDNPDYDWDEHERRHSVQHSA